MIRPAIGACLAAAAFAASASPRQIHVSYGSDPTSNATIVWASEAECVPAAQFGPAPNALVNVSSASLVAEPEWTFDNALGLHYYMRAYLTSLPPGARTFYRVGCTNGEWSAALNFSTVPSAEQEQQPRILIWGDMGKVGGEQTLPALVAEAEAAANGSPDAATFAIIAGDFAYDLNDAQGEMGATFMDRLARISSLLPTMTTMGNHEQATGNATHYTNILGRGMPGPALGHWYSFEAGLVHFVMLSSEVWHMPPFNLTGNDGAPLEVSAPAQLAWLEGDLAAVNRSRTPWLVAVYHRPMYCSNADGDECTNEPLNWPTNPLRLALEPLFLAAGVDVAFEAHEHSVEIIYPISDGVVTARGFSAPRAPVHWVTGAAGCNEDWGLCQNRIANASFFTHKYLDGLRQYSYSRAWAVNASVFHIEQVAVRPSPPAVWTAVDIVQPAHGPFKH